MYTQLMDHTLKDGILDYKMQIQMHHLEYYLEEFYHNLEIIIKILTKTYHMSQSYIIKETVHLFKLSMDFHQLTK